MKSIRLIIDQLPAIMIVAIMIVTMLGSVSLDLYAVGQPGAKTRAATSETVTTRAADSHTGELIFSGTVETPTCQITVEIDGQAPTTGFSATVTYPRAKT